MATLIEKLAYAQYELEMEKEAAPNYFLNKGMSFAERKALQGGIMGRNFARNVGGAKARLGERMVANAADRGLTGARLNKAKEIAGRARGATSQARGQLGKGVAAAGALGAAAYGLKRMMKPQSAGEKLMGAIKNNRKALALGGAGALAAGAGVAAYKNRK